MNVGHLEAKMFGLKKRKKEDFGGLVALKNTTWN